MAFLRVFNKYHPLPPETAKTIRELTKLSALDWRKLFIFAPSIIGKE